MSDPPYNPPGAFGCDDVIGRAHVSRKRTQQAAPASRGRRWGASSRGSRQPVRVLRRILGRKVKGWGVTELSDTYLIATAVAASGRPYVLSSPTVVFGGGLQLRQAVIPLMLQLNLQRVRDWPGNNDGLTAVSPHVYPRTSALFNKNQHTKKRAEHIIESTLHQGSRACSVGGEVGWRGRGGVCVCCMLRGGGRQSLTQCC